MIKTKFKQEEELKDIIEETFDLCSSNRDEIRWLICFLRGIMQIPNKRTEYHAENFKINQWQYNLYFTLEKYRKRWSCSNE